MAKCMLCRKSLFRCRCYESGGIAEKTTAQVKDKNGRTRTVTRNTGNTVRNGNTWCGTCSCRVLDGRCTNVQCSQNT
jgi:hypothetical protein